MSLSGQFAPPSLPDWVIDRAEELMDKLTAQRNRVMEIREEVEGITMTRWKAHWVVTTLCTGIVLLLTIGGCAVLATLFVQ